MIWFLIGLAVAIGIIYLAIVTSKEDEGEAVDTNTASLKHESGDELSVKDKLILGAGAAKLIEIEEEHYQQRKAEQEQKRLDELNWQEAARRKDPFGNDDGSDEW